MTERTLVLVKPDGVQRQLIGRILARYEERGLKVVGLKLVQVDRDLAERHYAAHREKPFFGGLVDFITSSPLVALALEGPNAIARRPRDQRRDPPARGCAGHDPRRLRARDRPEHRPRVGRPRGRRGELALWFRADELLDYERDIDRWVLARTTDATQFHVVASLPATLSRWHQESPCSLDCSPWSPLGS